MYQYEYEAIGLNSVTHETFKIELIHETFDSLSTRKRHMAHYMEAFEWDNEMCIRIEDVHFLVPISHLNELFHESCHEYKFSENKKLYEKEKEVEIRRKKAKMTALSPIQLRGFEIFVKNKDPDFTITSNQNGSFPVHSYLLCGLWPWFEAAISSGMQEEETKTVHLPYPETWIAVLVDFLYGKKVEGLDLATAVGLLDIASIYDVPQLKEFVSVYIFLDKEPVTVETALDGWRIAYVADVPEVQKFFAGHLVKHMSQVEDSPASEKYTDEQSLALYREVAKLVPVINSRGDVTGYR